MKKGILILLVSMISVNLAWAGSLLPFTLDSFSGNRQTICNNNDVCENGEDNQNCPNDCLNIPPQNLQQNEIQNNQIQTASRENQNTEFRQNIIIKEKKEFPWKILFSVFFAIVAVVIIIFLYLWIKKSEPVKRIILKKEKPKENLNKFGLPQRPARRFGI